jgi:hypothetical protein
MNGRVITRKLNIFESGIRKRNAYEFFLDLSESKMCLESSPPHRVIGHVAKIRIYITLSQSQFEGKYRLDSGLVFPCS